MPPASDEQAFFRRMLQIEEAADSENWTLADSLQHYLRQIEVDAKPEQRLKKPGDGKAARADFIVRMRSHLRLSSSEVATVASVMLDDESIDDRLVRRLTAGRADSSES